MKNILVVEDDIDIHNLIKEILEKEQYKVFDSYSGTECLLLEKEKIDLILLDLMLPGLNGEEVIKRVKNIPIIVLSAKSSYDSKVNVLLSGANDYITKPFNKDELLARIKVQLRLSENKMEDSLELKYKDLNLNLDTRNLSLKDKSVQLTKTEFAIMKQLLINSGSVVTKSRLLDLINIDTEDCDENSLKVHISNIRRKIRKLTDVEYIEAVWGIGFKMCD